MLCTLIISVLTSMLFYYSEVNNKFYSTLEDGKKSLKMKLTYYLKT